jgi:CRP-like cAMP-binding protein
MIESGGLLLFRADQNGAEVALDLLAPGGLCGIEDVLCDGPYALSARATTRTACYSIPSDVIRGIISSDAPAAIAIANYVAVRLRLAEKHMEILALEKTAGRIERVLRRLARRSESRNGSDLCLPLTQGDLASLVGISRQSVNRSLKDLRLRGIVKCHPRHIAVSEAFLS